MSFAPPVSRDGFHYNGDLYVEVGNLNRHKRASVDEITHLLRPDLKKGNKPPGKDEFGHWYEAQLIHYGLPPSKDKARAKMRLLEALNASTLTVPPEIVRLEASLRKEFDVAERKAKAFYKASTADSVEKSGSIKKRKQSDGIASNATTVNVNLNFGGFGEMGSGAGPNVEFPTASFTQQQASSPPKKARTSMAKAPSAIKKQTARKTMPAIEKEPAMKKQTARKTTFAIEKEPVIKKQTARRTIPAKEKEPVIKQTARKTMPMIKKDPMIGVEPAIKKNPAIKKQTARKSMPMIKNEPAIKQESPVKNEPEGHNQPSLGLINGYYDISAPDIEYSFDCDRDTLSLILCLDTPRVWGSFQLGPLDGIWHLPQRPYQPSEDPLPFHWRGRSHWQGQLRVGEDCVGDIAFLGDGRIKGRLNISKDEGYCFSGMRRPGPTMAPRPAISMREEWEEYNSMREEWEGYDGENRMRE